MCKSVPGEPRIESGYRVANYRELKKDNLPRYFDSKLRLCSNSTLVMASMRMNAYSCLDISSSYEI